MAAFSSDAFSTGAFSVDAFDFGAVTATTTARPSGGIPYRGPLPRTKDDIRRDREKFGVIPRRIIEDVAARQVQRLETDQQKILDELLRELQISGLEWDARYLEALNELRSSLIDAEIARRLRQRLENEELILMLLMVGAAL